jgi:hypothetical protein
VRVLVFLILGGLVACESKILRDGSVESSSGSGEGGDGLDAGAGRPGAGPGGADGGGAPGGGAPARVGVVFVGNITDITRPGEIGGAVALFEEVIEDAGCVDVDLGPCTYTTCGDAVWSDVPFADAGAMQVTGTSVGLPDPVRIHDGSYGGWVEERLFVPGDAIGVTFAGATVPAFESSVVAPARFVDVSPSPITLTTLSRSVPIELSWELEGGQEGWMRVQIAPIFELVGDGLGYQSVECVVPLADRALTVPAEALRRLEDRDSLSIRLRGMSWTETVSGDWRVFVDAQHLLLIPDITLTD